MILHPGSVGIDVSKAFLDIFDPLAGHAERIPNTPAAIAARAEAWRDRAVFVVFEATGRYDRALRLHLAEAGISHARVNPGRARDFARAAGFLAKTDTIDARMLAVMGQALQPDAEPPRSPERERLLGLHRRRDQLVATRQQERTRLSEASCDDNRDSLNDHIVWLTADIARFDKRIARLVASVAELASAWLRLRQAPGVGPVTATTLMALMPELGSLSPKEIAALAGLAPLNRDSGQLRGQRSIAGGRKRVRDALYMAAVSASRTKSRFGDLYRAMRERGKPAKVALIAVARKLLITLNAMIRDNSSYAP